MKSARTQSFCRKHNMNIGYNDGFRIDLTRITERKKNNFCLIWKSNDFSFNQAIKEIKDNFKAIDNVISDKHIKSFIKYEYKPEKVQSQLTNMIIYDLKPFNTDRVVPYANFMYRKRKISSKKNRDIIDQDYEKCRKDCFVFKGRDSNNEMVN